MNMDTTILNKILANQFLQSIKMIIHHDQVGLVVGVQGKEVQNLKINLCTLPQQATDKKKSHDYIN